MTRSVSPHGPLVRALFVVTLAAALAACGLPEGLVGGRCTNDRECAYLCVRGNDNWPDGICTRRCSRDLDCPNGTACVNEEGGICAALCEGASQCARYGNNFTCGNRDRRGAPGSVQVCRVP